MYIKELTEKISKYCEVNKENIFNKDVVIEGITFLKLRDKLYLIGEILEESINENIYVVSVSINSNFAIIAIKLVDQKLYMVGYAEEGLIKQNTCEKAFDRIINYKKMANGRSKLYLSIAVILSILIIVIIFFLNDNIQYKKSLISETTLSTRGYNEVINEFNHEASLYNNAVSQISVDNIENLPNNIGELKKESEIEIDIIKALDEGNTSEKIKDDTDTIKEMISTLRKKNQILKQITAPSEAFIKERLSNVDSITNLEAVTPENNPDGLLNQEGGYISCIYFTIDTINNNGVNNVIELGTDGGGAVEVYSTLADAKARCDYLGSFDQTILYSGSYALVGTMVIRTSYSLTSEQQYNLTNDIIESFTK